MRSACVSAGKSRVIVQARRSTIRVIAAAALGGVMFAAALVFIVGPAMADFILGGSSADSWLSYVGVVLAVATPFLMAVVAGGPTNPWLRGGLGLVAGVGAAGLLAVLVEADSLGSLAALVFAVMAVFAVFGGYRSWIAGSGVLIAVVLLFSFFSELAQLWLGLVAVVLSLTAGQAARTPDSVEAPRS